MTSQQDALYRAVCEFPDEDTPRLIFADCVEDSGDAIRAEFIRTQIELARVPEHDPLWSMCRQRNPNAILGCSLSYALPAIPAGFSWRGYHMRRGFTWKASVVKADGFSEHAASLFNSAPIQALDFDHASGVKKHLAKLVECQHLAKLRRTEFSLTRFEEREAQLLSAMPNITEVAFTDHAITAEGLQSLAGSPLASRLTDLELERAALPPALLVDALAATRTGKLLKLVLADCLLPAPDAAHLVSLPFLQTLDTLDLSDNPLRGEGVQALAASRMLSNLEVLKLGRTFPGVPGVQALAESQSFPRLRWLDLSANRLGPVAVRILTASRFAPGLKILDLSQNPIGGSGSRALADSADLAGLQELVLRSCEIGDDGAIALAESPHLDGLLRLDLRDSTVSAKPFRPEVQRKLASRFGPRVSFDLQ